MRTTGRLGGQYAAARQIVKLNVDTHLLARFHDGSADDRTRSRSAGDVGKLGAAEHIARCAAHLPRRLFEVLRTDDVQAARLSESRHQHARHGFRQPGQVLGAGDVFEVHHRNRVRARRRVDGRCGDGSMARQAKNETAASAATTINVTAVAVIARDTRPERSCGPISARAAPTSPAC